MTRPVAVSLDCQCGRETPSTRERGKIECECGAVYAVTVTELREPSPDA